MYVYVRICISTYTLVESVEGPLHGTFHQHRGGGGEISPKGDSTATCLGGWMTFDLPGRTRSALSACPFSTTKVSLNYQGSLTS